MKFMLDIKIDEPADKIDYRDKIMLVGSPRHTFRPLFRRFVNYFLHRKQKVYC
jgi:hypothetical protein